MKNKKGITLIALVITIIVLLILAGVSISTLSGEEGILTKAKTSSEKTKIEDVKEQIKLELSEKKIDKQEALTDDEIMDVIKSYDKDGKVKGYTYIETEDGQKIDITDIHEFIFGVEIKPGLNKDEDNEKKYYVYTAEGFSYLNQLIAEKTLGNDVYIEIMKDIDCTDYVWNTVISHTEQGFSLKEMNGNGHTISNLTINGKSLFSILAGSGDVQFKDIIFDGTILNSSDVNVAVLTSQVYQNILMDNVVIKNSEITGSYKVAPFIGTVYDENSSNGITATLKNCKVENCTIKATGFDFGTTGVIASVFSETSNDRVVFEGNNLVKNIKLYAPNNGYELHANLYTTDADTDDLVNEAENVTIENVTFENI